MAVQFRASIPVPGSEPRARASVQPGSNTPSSSSPNSILRLKDGAEALRNSILVPADPSSSAIPTIIQPPKDKSRLPGLPQIAQQPGTLASFAYAFGRRLAKTVNGAATQFLYDGLDIAQQLEAQRTTTYLRSLAIDETLGLSNPDGAFFLTADALGSTLYSGTSEIQRRLIARSLGL